MCNEFCVGIHLVPMGQEHTWENKGLKDINVIWMEGKQQVTCCVSCASNGMLFPFQVIFISACPNLKVEGNDWIMAFIS
jgi:hypothetical protein